MAIPGLPRDITKAEKKDMRIFADLHILNGAPVGIRTLDLLIRSQTLYPAELRARIASATLLYYNLKRQKSTET